MQKNARTLRSFEKNVCPTLTAKWPIFNGHKTVRSKNIKLSHLHNTVCIWGIFWTAFASKIFGNNSEVFAV